MAFISNTYSHMCTRKFVTLLIQGFILVELYPISGNTENSLSHRFISDVGRYGGSIDENDANSLDGIYIITEQRWHGDAVLPLSFLPVAEGMSAWSNHRLQQSASGLDDAGMDLQASHLGTSVGQEVGSTASLSWIESEVHFPVIICALAGAILFTFIILIWLRKQMSSEKNPGDSDRRGLVEDGVVETSSCIEKPAKSIQESPLDTKWVQHPIHNPPVGDVPITLVSKARGLPEVMSVATPERRPDPIRIRAKGLLERRGSSASLTIELAPVPENPHLVTPTRECTSAEFLLSAGNVLSRAQLRKSITDPTSLHKEFWEVPLNVPEKVEIFGAGIKNRYSAVLPNSQSRVILDGIDDPVGSYINANYIRGYDGECNRYIATQGPLPNTVTDFWRMVWLNNVSAVVMMTRLHESSKTKCDMYFPIDLDTRIQTGNFTITATSLVTRGGYTIRDFEVIMEGERRTVTHYWYDSWPDHAVPQSADSLVSLASEINSLPGPVVVHCSAGIGRTGCFIALANGMIQLIRNGNVDVLGILCQMRYDRGGMVQTAEQYEFVHRALCIFEQTLDDKSSTTRD